VKMLNQYRSRLACDGCRFWQALEGTSLYACHRALYTDKLRATVVGGKLRWMPKWQCYRPGWGAQKRGPIRKCLIADITPVWDAKTRRIARASAAAGRR
jgi:hypothetical protein